MSWNYRVIRSKTDFGYVYQVHEVYYDEHGYIEGWTSEPVKPMGETLQELAEDIDMMSKDVKNHSVLSDVDGQLIAVETW